MTCSMSGIEQIMCEEKIFQLQSMPVTNHESGVSCLISIRLDQSENKDPARKKISSKLRYLTI